MVYCDVEVGYVVERVGGWFMRYLIEVRKLSFWMLDKVWNFLCLVVIMYVLGWLGWVIILVGVLVSSVLRSIELREIFMMLMELMMGS